MSLPRVMEETEAHLYKYRPQALQDIRCHEKNYIAQFSVLVIDAPGNKATK